MEEKFSELQKYLSIRNINLKNQEQEMIPVGDDDDSRQPAGLADRTQKGNGQRYRDRQTCEGSTTDGKLILHKLCEPPSAIAGTAVGKRPEGPQPYNKVRKN